MVNRQRPNARCFKLFRVLLCCVVLTVFLLLSISANYWALLLAFELLNDDLSLSSSTTYYY